MLTLEKQSGSYFRRQAKANFSVMCQIDNIDIFQANQCRFTNSIVDGTELFCVNWSLILFKAPAMVQNIPLELHNGSTYNLILNHIVS